MKKDKHYWAMYYGIDENLPDDEFYQEIEKRNRECEESTKKFIKRSDHL